VTGIYKCNSAEGVSAPWSRDFIAALQMPTPWGWQNTECHFVQGLNTPAEAAKPAAAAKPTASAKPAKK
jgi:hypothetical protein